MTETMQDNLSYQKVLDGLLRMHQLFIEGKRQSEEIKKLRNEIDEPYSDLTQKQREVIEGLSSDLFDVEKIISEPVLDRVPAAEEKICQALSAQHAGRYDEALQLLRDSRSSKPFSRISYCRGRNWEGKNEPKVALLFFNHAVQLDPQNEEYKASALSALCEAIRSQDRR